MDTLAIDMENICVKAGLHYLLKDISWQVKPGEHWVVFGRNGCGKTTLLSIAAGYKPATSGKVTFFGQRLDEHNILNVRKRIGWVSSSFFDRFYKNESPLEIILSAKSGTFGLDNTLNDGDIKLAKWLLAQFGLTERAGHRYGAMSKGERQSVLIARALFTMPDILILDEPCSGLDLVAREKLFRLIERIAKDSSITILYVTHYAEEILDCFEHTLLLRRGRVYAQGTTEEMIKEDTLSAFLETPVTIKACWQKRLLLEQTAGEMGGCSYER